MIERTESGTDREKDNSWDHKNDNSMQAMQYLHFKALKTKKGK